MNRNEKFREDLEFLPAKIAYIFGSLISNPLFGLLVIGRMLINVIIDENTAEESRVKS